jgi:hypothetical protein
MDFFSNTGLVQEKSLSHQILTVDLRIRTGGFSYNQDCQSVVTNVPGLSYGCGLGLSSPWGPGLENGF